MPRPSSTSRLAEDYKRAFWQLRAAGQVEEPLFDGVLELLDRLEDDGWLLAVATGKSDRGLKHCLEQNGIHARFVSLQTADRHPSKPHPVDGASRRSRTRARRPKRRSSSATRASTWRWPSTAGATPIGAGWGYHDARRADRSGRRRGRRAAARRPRSRSGACGWMTTRERGTGCSPTRRCDLAGWRSSSSALRSCTPSLLRPGGWPQVGAIVAILGVIDAVLAPRAAQESLGPARPRTGMKRFWKTVDVGARGRAAGRSGSTAARCGRPPERR